VRTYAFDDAVVDPAAFSLTRSGAAVRIEPKALEVLIYLIERGERVVAKQELLDAVWTGTTVTENALTRAVAQVRKVLGDDVESPRYIQTIPTKGYRFIGHLSVAGGFSLPQADRQAEARLHTEAAPPRRRRRVWPWLVGLLVLLGLFAAFVIGVNAVNQRRIARVVKAEIAAIPRLAARAFRPSDRLQVFPTFSPDGLSLAYASDVDGTPHIFVAALRGADEVQVTRGADGATQPAWSPDGQSIAYTSARGRGIWIVPAKGGEAKRLTTFGSRPAWSSDGNEVAFQSGESIEYGWTAFEALPPSSISIVNVRTGVVTPLTRPSQPPGGHAAPAWRSDGTRLAFTSCDIERCAVYTVARDGSAIEEIVSDSRRLMSPVFARDGRSLQYVLVRYNDSLLLSVPLDAEARRAGGPQKLRQSGPGVMQHVAISPDGTRYAWSQVEEASDLVSVPVGGGEPVPLTRNPTLRTSFPAFSPDGNRIAYCAVAAGVDSGVWIADADGKNPKALAVGPRLKQHTHWSRSGYEVLYSEWQDRGPGLLSASLITGRSTLVATLTKNSSAPMLTSGVTTIASTVTLADATAVRVGKQQITSPADLARFPVWSPSGKSLVMQVRRADGSIAVWSDAKLRVLPVPHESLPYSWSPDEKQIAFAGRRDGVWNVFTVSLDGTTRQVTEYTSTKTWVRSPAWSPDGSTIVFELGAPRANVWVSEPSAGRP
jgi:Tol biopolymer transport system component/DNA-binding winged helix-turn-helix (wHTH) protein